MARVVSVLFRTRVAPVAWCAMKTRTLLMMSVGTALMILLAGGVLLVQLTGAETTSKPTPFAERTMVGDLDITVFDVIDASGVVSVDVAIGGVDDGLDSIRLVTGDQRLAPIDAPQGDRCTEITVDDQRCTIDFDTSASSASNRVLVVRRGDEQATWRL